MNRLHLNFQINSTKERTEFLKEYLKREEFVKKPLTEEELETCANYILWGKDIDGKNSVQRKEIQIKTKNGTWDVREDESLDALIENGTFSEFQHPIHYKINREVFSRQKTLQEAPSTLIPIFKELFAQIDYIDLLLNYYDLAHNKRKKPPRAELLQNFSISEQEKIKEESTHLNPYKYLKMRHLLVELRRQQYSLRDSYVSQIQRHTSETPQPPANIPTFETDINIYPLGLFNSLLFKESLIPESFSEKELEKISHILWKKRAQYTEDKKNKKFLIDFRDLEHVQNLFLLYFDLEDSSFLNNIENTTDLILKTLEYYTKQANLNEVQKDIIYFKMLGKKNHEVAILINKKYGKTYTANYISTLFRQKIIKQINEAARYHELVIENIFFPENFKKCSHCGRTYLIDSHNFIKKARSKDGFANKCKLCDKKDRERIKEK